MIAQGKRNDGEVRRITGERKLNGGASYIVAAGVNFVDVVFSGMNDYCVNRVRNELAELIHIYFEETQASPRGIRMFRKEQAEERDTLMPTVERREGAVILKFSDRSALWLDRGNVYVSFPLDGKGRPYKGFMYKAERFRDGHNEETLRAALERWGKMAS
jgi:hypothetical protein